jgi:hypothetical protein
VSIQETTKSYSSLRISDKRNKQKKIGVVFNYIMVHIEPPINCSDKLTLTRVSLNKVNKSVSWLFEKV